MDDAPESDPAQAISKLADAGEIGPFLAALSLVLRETIARFEHCASRITDIVQPSRGSRELIVAFQEFDRLQQEFAALGNVLAHFAENATADSHNSAQAIDAITIGNVKDRLNRYMREPVRELAPEQAEEVVF
ncbi:MAG: hypothetical protein AB7O50_04740 [Pseudolabrys sp.]